MTSLNNGEILLKKEISNLIKSVGECTINDREWAAITSNMIKAKKKELVLKIYQRSHPRANGFYQCSDGRWRSRNPDIYAHTEEELIDKLYGYYVNDSVEAIFNRYIMERQKEALVKTKTIEEDIGYWKRILSKEPLLKKPISSITVSEIYHMFEIWTGARKITRKEFCNRKSVLNGIFGKAVLEGIIDVNPITSIDIRRLRFRESTYSAVEDYGYSVEQREKLLKYLSNKSDYDAYDAAIDFMFHSYCRIGEVRALRRESVEFDKNRIVISQQMVDERKLIIQDDKVTLGKNTTEIYRPKGNPHYSVRFIELTPCAREIIRKAMELNPDGEYLFMHHGRVLTDDTINRRLKKYCSDINIPYRSCHKIRFTSAAISYDAGMPIKSIQKVLGHSTPSMTMHYLGIKVNEVVDGEISRILG